MVIGFAAPRKKGPPECGSRRPSVAQPLWSTLCRKDDQGESPCNYFECVSRPRPSADYSSEIATIMSAASSANCIAAPRSLVARPTFNLATTVAYFSFLSASGVSGINPFPLGAQGFGAAELNPSPLGPTRQLIALCIR